MGKGQHLSRYQQGIVKRYYQNADTISVSKLSELVSELAVAEPKAAVKLWTRVEQALQRVGVEPEQVKTIVTARDLKGLATLVGEIWNGARKAPTGPKRSEEM